MIERKTESAHQRTDCGRLWWCLPVHAVSACHRRWQEGTSCASSTASTCGSVPFKTPGKKKKKKRPTTTTRHGDAWVEPGATQPPPRNCAFLSRTLGETLTSRHGGGRANDVMLSLPVAVVVNCSGGAGGGGGGGAGRCRLTKRERAGDESSWWWLVCDCARWRFELPMY